MRRPKAEPAVAAALILVDGAVMGNLCTRMPTLRGEGGFLCSSACREEVSNVGCPIAAGSLLGAAGIPDDTVHGERALGFSALKEEAVLPQVPPR